MSNVDYSLIIKTLEGHITRIEELMTNSCISVEQFIDGLETLKQLREHKAYFEKL